MAYEGYFRLAGVEIANAARTVAYTGSLMPTFGLDDCTDCEGLIEALGDGPYTTPAQDGAPWVDSSNPGLNDFWGVYPLGVSGIDDSTRTASVTELTGNGAVVSLPRRAGREMRFDALLVGKDKRAVMEGFHWLDRALDGVRCGDRSLGCTGAPLEFFSSCPPVCGYSGCPDVVADLSSGDADGWYASGNNPTVEYTLLLLCPDSSEEFGIRGTDVGPQDLVLTRVMSGLIPGAWYKFQAVVSGWNNQPIISVRGTDASIVSTVTSNETQCTDAALTTLWFQATSPVMYLDITSATPSTDASNIHNTNITEFSVVRADPAADVYKTTWPDDGSLLNGWEPGEFTNATTSVNRSFFNNVYTAVDWQVPTTSAGGMMAIFSEDDFFLRRTIRGLIPGQTYVVRLSANMSLDDLDQPEGSVRLRVDGVAESEVILDTADVISYFGLTVEFTATSDQHTVTIMPGSVTMYLEPDEVFRNRVSMSLFSLAIEATSNELPPYPDPALPYRRTLYRTTALTGPTIEERYDKVCGYMMRVSFGLHAGIPDQYGELVSAGSALNQSSFITGTFECVGDEQVRTNLIPNPSGEQAALIAPWEGYNLESAVATGSDPGVARFGDGYFVVTLDSPGATSFAGITYDINQFVPIIPGSFIMSAYIGGDIAPNTFAELQVDVLDPGENFLEHKASTAIPLPAGLRQGDGMVRIDFPFTVSDLASGLQPSIRVDNFSEENWDPTIYIDGILLESGGALLPYFDGSFPNAEWTGAANQSESIFTPSTVADLIDPDCPPLPVPPQPPSIEEECVSEPIAWLRYAIEVPGSQIPLFSSVRPVITIITGDVAVRQVRTRWYPNPEGVEVTQLRQCDFTGEMTASYVPPNSEFTIDGIAQDAVSVNANGDVSTATHLLYGPGGGPVEWPELSCNVPYIFTVDVEATGDLAEVDILLQLGLKV